MNFARVFARGRLGIEAPLVSVEVFISRGLPSLSIVGLPETAVRESKDRVRSAIIHAGFEFPKYRVIVNLGPADLPKEGGRYDLAIAIGLLAASEQIPSDTLEQLEFIGELSLAGDLCPIPGALASSIASSNDNRKLILPLQNLNEASLFSKAKALGATNLISVCEFLNQQNTLHQVTQSTRPQVQHSYDMNEVLAQPFAKKALEIAAAGQHHILLVGSPGSGKTMLAERLMTIQPDISEQDSLEIARLYSCRGLWTDELWGQRPFRSPHHTSSAVALVGGGSRPLPGEISLSHKGVLFLDELPEFDRRVLEVLREPLESRTITLSRAALQVTYPANFQLIAAMNPCPCGFKDDPIKQCSCSPQSIDRYQSKLSGPLLDRIDLQVRVPPVKHELLFEKTTFEESSSMIKQRVLHAVQLQLERQNCFNAQLKGKQLQNSTLLENEAQHFLIKAAESLQLSARSMHRVLRVARTIADLEKSLQVTKKHISQALSFRL